MIWIDNSLHSYSISTGLGGGCIQGGTEFRPTNSYGFRQKIGQHTKEKEIRPIFDAFAE